MKFAQKCRLGWHATLIGVAMVTGSIIVAAGFGVGGSALHTGVQIAGLALVLVGYFGLGGRQHHRRGRDGRTEA